MAIQDKFNKANTIYKITKDIDLEATTLTIPANCTLDFQGGIISNGAVVLNNTLLKGIIELNAGITATVSGTYRKGQILWNDALLKLQVYNGTTWVSMGGGALFKWSDDNKIQISYDEGATWEDLSPEFADNVRIIDYVASVAALPTDAPNGAMYMVGPAGGTGTTYNLYIKATSGWIDNGSFTSVSAGIVQTTGTSTTEVMSQKAVTDALNVANNNIDILKSNIESSETQEVSLPKDDTTLFNHIGKAISGTTGLEVDSVISSNCTGFVPYVAGTDITAKMLSVYASYGMAFYDEDFNFLIGHVYNQANADNIFSNPTAAYFRATSPNGVSFSYTKLLSTIDVNSNRINQIDNRFNYNSSKTVVKEDTSFYSVNGKAISGTSGAEIDNVLSGGACSDYIDYIVGTEVIVNMSSSYNSYGIAFYDANHAILGNYAFNFTGQRSFTSNNPSAVYFRATKPNGDLQYSIASVIDLPALQDDVNSLKNSSNSVWRGKTIYFCGTSIPQGGYPEIVCDLLGATCVNKAIGSSVLRKALRDGGGFTQFDPVTTDENYVRAFTATKAEKQALFGSTAYDQYSYEELLLPYLNGTYPMPDLFVIDYSADDKVRAGKNDPYFAAINTAENAALPADYPLAEDTMTASRGVQFNRNSYTGAALFIVDLILQYNPQARIMFMGFQNRELRPRQMEAQKVVSDYWQVPYYPLSDFLGWSNNIVYNSMAKFNSKYSPTYTTTEDVSTMKMWCPDGIHPHSNFTLNSLGYKESNYEIAKKVAAFINTI